MAALYEGYTLCSVVSSQNSPESGIQGIELDGDEDRVVITDSTRCITVYKVSDRKVLGSWTVKQAQTLTCPAVYNTQTQEYVVATDHRVIRVWKDEDINIDKAFKATVSADVHHIHSIPHCEPMVLFQRGAVRPLDLLLAAPQEPIEDILSEEEVIRWSTMVRAEGKLMILFSTERKGELLLYVQRLNPNSLVKYRLETEATGSAPLSFSATFRAGSVHLLCLYPNGCVYESLLTVRGPAAMSDEIQPLPRTLHLKLPVGEGELVSASAVPLDDAHLAVVGVPHPSAGAGKDYLCIWNTNFQTLQAGKEMAGRIYGQLWCNAGKLYVPHGKVLSVIPFECQKSSLATAMGRLKQSGESKCPTLVPSWNSILHDEDSQAQGPVRRMETRNRPAHKSQTASALTLDQLLERIKTGSEAEVQRELEAFLSKARQSDLQLAAGRLATELVSRCQAESAFYPQNALLHLVHTQCLCHSVCPDLLMLTLEKKDYALCQFCLQLFPDIPEAVSCACLKTILCIPDVELEAAALEPDSLAFVEGLRQSADPSPEEGAQKNGFCQPAPEEDGCDAPLQKALVPLDAPCPVSLHRGALLNDILQTPYCDSFLLPHLKDLTAPQVILFLQYLNFLYMKYSQNVNLKIPALRSPTMAQIMDWVCLLLDAHFTVLIMAPEAKSLLSALHKFVRSQMKLYSELGKIEGSLQAIEKTKQSEDVGQYSIEVIELL